MWIIYLIFTEKFVKFKEIYVNIMITLLIWGYSNFMLAPKLMNKQCCFSISRPSCCQRTMSRKSWNLSLSVILFRILQNHKSRTNSTKKLICFDLQFCYFKDEKKVCFSRDERFSVWEQTLVTFFQIVSKNFLFSRSFTFTNWFLYFSPNSPNTHTLTSNALITGSL